MEENAGNIKAGDTIVIKGICSGYISGDVDMGLARRCFFNKMLCFNLKNNMKRTIMLLCIIIVGINSNSFAQVYFTKNGKISFFSKTSG